MSDSLVPVERIANLIYLIQGEKVMLDSDLADLYQVETRTLNQAVKRNIDSFPTDFAFQISSFPKKNLTTWNHNLWFQVGEVAENHPKSLPNKV